MNTSAAEASAQPTRKTVALAGAGGSHPATLRAIAAALGKQSPDTPVVVFDLSAFDTRGKASYSDLPSVVLLKPEDVGMRQWFKTAAPNLVLAGGVRAYERMVAAFAQALRTHDVGVLLLSHSRGYPEQALLSAAYDAQIPVSQIDEGPFSIPFRPRDQPEAPQRSVRLALRGLRATGLLPPRDLSGDKVDLFLSTSPGRGRIMRERGLDESRLEVTPGPRFDELSSVAMRWPGRDGSGTDNRVLWTHQPFRADGKVSEAAADKALDTLVAGLLRVASSRPIKLCLRMHPRSDAAERARIAAAFAPLAPNVRFSEEAAFYEDLMQADLVTGFYSSTLLEAAAIGVPVVAVQIDPRAFKSKWEAEKMQLVSDYDIPTLSDPVELADTIVTQLKARLITPPPQLADAHIGRLGGGAKAVADILIKLRDSKRH